MVQLSVMSNKLSALTHLLGTHDVEVIPGLLLIFLHGCDINSGSGLETTMKVVSFPAHSMIVSHSHGEKSGEGLVSFLHHEPEMPIFSIAASRSPRVALE